MSNDRDGELPSWPEVKMLLESPSVSSETKRALALRYFDNIEDQENVELYGFESRDQFAEAAEKYRNELSISGWDTASESSWDGDVYDSYINAREEFDKARKTDSQKQAQDLKEDRNALNSLEEKASKSEVAVNNSNEILDLGNNCIKAIGDLVPPYNRARGLVAQQLPTYDLQDDIVKRYDEQRDIRFDKFTKFSDDLTAVADAMSGAWADQDTRMAVVFGDWAGQGQNSAQEAWALIRKGEDEVEQTLRDNALAVNKTSASVADSCRNKVRWMQKYEISGGFDGVEWYEINRLCNIAELGRNASDNDFKHFIQYMPPDLQTQMHDDCGDLEGELKDRAQEWAKDWLKGFCRWFSGYVEDFRQTCDNVREAVDGSWNALSEKLADSPTEAFTRAAGATGSASADVAGSSHASGAAPSGATTGGGGSAGGMGPGGTPSTPPAAAPSATQPPSVTESAVNTPNQELNPVTGKPLEVNPQTGEPYPIDPETGEVIKDLGEEQETLTVRQGDNEITMSEPNEGGEMTLSFVDGNGKPLDFTLDFQPDSGEEAGQVGGGDTASESRSGQDASDEGQQFFGPQGSGNVGQPDAAETVYTPGTDGKIHIEQGGLEIVAEQLDGPDGQTIVTVDDGSGEPITYALGEEASGQSGSSADQVGVSALRAGDSAEVASGERATSADGADRQEAVGFDGQLPGGVDDVQAGGGPMPAAETAQDKGDWGSEEEGTALRGQVADEPSSGDDGDNRASSDTPGNSGSTSAQAMFGDIFGGADSEPAAGVSGATAEQSALGAGQQADSAPPSEGAAGLGTAPGGGSAQQGMGAGSMGSMGMMGGAGVGGAGGGADQERGSSGYQIDGGLFEIGAFGNRISGTLDEAADDVTAEPA